MGWGGEQKGGGRGADWCTWEAKYTSKSTKSLKHKHITFLTSSFFFYKQSLISKLSEITREMEEFSKNKNNFLEKNYINDSELIVLQT